MHLVDEYLNYSEQQDHGLIQIHGGRTLSGTVSVQGSKNASLPLLAASILVPGKSTFQNCPVITDIFYMKKLLSSIGCNIEENDCTGEKKTHELQIDAKNVYDSRLPGEYVEKMRSSLILLGPLLARKGEAHLRLPGGCSIGKRPINYHIDIMRALGAEVTLTEADIHASCSHLTGANVYLPMASVGATENALLAAITAKGTTVIENAAREPEIMVLCDYLRQAGGKIWSQEKDNVLTITIQGVPYLNEVEYRVPADRIVAGTYLFGCVATGGEIILQNVIPSHMEQTVNVARQMGAECTLENDNELQADLKIVMSGRPKAVPFLETAVFPGFPTDMQSSFLVAASLASGNTVLCERIFEDRYQIVEELQRMGAKIQLVRMKQGLCAVVEGVETLQGCNTIAHELRGGASLVIAGIAAHGITTVGNTYYIHRGYENIGRDLNRLGANIGVAVSNS